MSSQDPGDLFDFLFREQKQGTTSEAGRQARERLESDKVTAAQNDIDQSETTFRVRPSDDSAYELGECYQCMIEILSGSERLTQRRAVKAKLLTLLRWMKENGIDLGDAEAELRSLEIESCYWEAERGL
jgi:hypothetical protein